MEDLEKNMVTHNSLFIENKDLVHVGGSFATLPCQHTSYQSQHT